MYQAEVERLLEVVRHRVLRLLHAHSRLTSQQGPCSSYAPSHRDRFNFHCAARLLLELVRGEGRNEVTLRLPRAFPLHRPEGHLRDACRAGLGGGRPRASPRSSTRATPRFGKLLERSRGLVNEVRPFPIDAV